MISKDIAKKIRQIELHTRRLLRGSLIGDSRSAIKGTGFEFDQIRDYQMGDDVRFIDWHASSRMQKMLVKQYIEERSRTVMLAVDVSGSSFFGSRENFKRDTFAEIASVLALVADSGKDRVGLILFSDHIEEYMPPSTGRGHLHAIMQKLFSFTPTGRKTDINCAFKKLAQIKKRDLFGIIVSDFIDTKLDTSLIRPVCKKYDVVAVRCLDKWEQDLASIGFLQVQDPETGETLCIDSRSNNSLGIQSYMKQRIETQNKSCTRAGLKMLDVANNDEFIADLIRFFARRMRY